MENLSTHVSYTEATQSQAAVRLGIDNTPSPAILETMKVTATHIFEPLRALVSKERGIDSPIIISSFFRSQRLNGAIGGAASSQHCKGEAIDMECYYPGLQKSDLFTLVRKNLEFDQLIWEFGDDNQPAWVHVSYSAANRRQVLKAVLINGVTKYLPI